MRTADPELGRVLTESLVGGPVAENRGEPGDAPDDASGGAPGGAPGDEPDGEPWGSEGCTLTGALLRCLLAGELPDPSAESDDEPPSSDRDDGDAENAERAE